MKKSLGVLYGKMREVWGEQTFEKTFGREIVRGDEVERVVGEQEAGVGVWLAEVLGGVGEEVVVD